MVSSASLFGILVSASKILANSVIALFWDSPTRKGDYGLGVCKAFSRSESAWMAISIELYLGMFINTGNKSIVFLVVSPPVSML